MVYAYVNWTAMTPGAVALVSLPLFHVVGMQNSMNLCIYIGCTMVMMTRWDRQVAAELIPRHRVTHWRSITTMAIDFFSHPDLDSIDLSSLVAIGGGGAQVPKAVAESIREKTGLHYVEGYGLSETIAATHINPPEAPKPQCLGIPIFDVDSRIVDPSTLQELGINETGEIAVHGPQVFQGYWQRPEETRAVFFDLDGKSFFRTGDLGYVDEQGYFFLVDRLKRMINASGYKIWPAEIESLMHDHADIHEVCVIATSDARRGEQPKAVVVLRAGASADAEAIQSWCKAHMASYKVPIEIAFVDSLPKSHSGKILWRELQTKERQSVRADSISCST
jgi:fatty-acyl-CoA synthase